jgi:hypothetical protein
MNTNPDETKLALWLDDELKGEELAAFEAWVADKPEHLAAREEIRRFRGLMAEALPVSEEPPYGELFNGRIARAIREQPEATNVVPIHRFAWRSLIMPLAACAGMMIAFWGGTRVKPGVPEIDVTGAPRAIPVEPIIYTPERGVRADWFASDDASATVIVLDGVAAIPDEMDFTKTVSTEAEREIDSTAGNDEPMIDEFGL